MVEYIVHKYIVYSVSFGTQFLSFKLVLVLYLFLLKIIIVMTVVIWEMYLSQALHFY